MKKVLIILVSMVAGIIIASCGGAGGSGTCTFDVTDFTNGANASSAISAWACSASGSPDFTFAFYDDEAGYSSYLGPFTWSEVGCQSFDVAASNGTNHITNAAGSIASGVGTFTQTTPNGVVLSATCTLLTCPFDIGDFTNGANATVATSVWDCTASGVPDFTFAFFDDGAGASSAIGVFTWSQVGCQSFEVVASNGTNYITDAAGSRASGIGTFTQTTPDGEVLSVSCTLRDL